MSEPKDADARRAVKPVICYPVETLPAPDMAMYTRARDRLSKVDEVLVPARHARCFSVPRGHFFRITSVEGAQGWRSQPAQRAGCVRAVLLREDTRPAWHASDDRSAHVVQFPAPAADGDDHAGYVGLVWHRSFWRVGARCDRHPLRSLYACAVVRRGTVS